MNTPVITIIGVLISGMIGVLILYLRKIDSKIDKNIEDMTKRLDNHDTKIDQINVNFAACKIDCERNTVSKEDWVRSEGYTRTEIKKFTEVLGRIEGKLTIIERLPEITGQITRSIVEGLKHEQ